VKGNRSKRASYVLARGALALNGCGGDTETNGLEGASAAQVQRKAAAALESAKSVHVKGTNAFGDGSAQIDLRIEGASGSGTLTVDGMQLAITRVRDVTYIKAGQRMLKLLGAGPAAQRGGADRWLKLGPQQVTALEGFSVQELAAQLAGYDSPVKPRVGQATLDGEKVVVVGMEDGSKVYVANTGPAYPLHGEYTGKDPGRLDFTEYGADFGIAAPEHPLDIGKLRES
jgi:hypothetical protein